MRASAASRSSSELCVPSIWLESTASLRTYMATNSSRLGRICVEPSSRPSACSASAERVSSSGVRSSGGVGGRGAGMKAR